MIAFSCVFPFAEDQQAFLHYAHSSGIELAPVSSYAHRGLPMLLTMTRHGDAGMLRTVSGQAIGHGPNGFVLMADREAPSAQPLQVTDMPDGTIAVSLDGAFLQADPAGRVVPGAGSATEALQLRLLGSGAAFGRAEEQLRRGVAAAQPVGRLLRFARGAAADTGPIEFRNARVVALDWIALMPDGTSHVPPTAHVRRRMGHGAVAYPLPAPGRLDAACLLGGYYNYYHHLVDYMVNWFDLRDRIAEDVPLLTLPPTQRFQAEILDAFGIAHRAVPMPPLSVRRVGRLFVPRPVVVHDGKVRDVTAIEACRAFLDTRIAPRVDAPRRIFISRATAPSRRAVNEAEAIAIAERHGFTAIRLETLSFLEQVALFRRVEAVAGLHGAGFANLIFAPAGCRVIEIMPTDAFRPKFFANLSAGLGQRFECVDARGSFSARDLEIDLGAFAAALPD